MIDSILGVIHWNTSPEIFSIGSFEVRYYTLCFLLAFISSYVLMLRIFRRENKSQELLDQLSIYIFIGTLLGARLGHCLFYEFDYYKDHPLEMILPYTFDANGNFKLTGFHGLASHGGALAYWLVFSSSVVKQKLISFGLPIGLSLLYRWRELSFASGISSIRKSSDCLRTCLGPSYLNAWMPYPGILPSCMRRYATLLSSLSCGGYITASSKSSPASFSVYS